MNKAYLFSFIMLSILGCSKTSENKATLQLPVIHVYKLYLNADTTFNTNVHVVSDILVKDNTSEIDYVNSYDNPTYNGNIYFNNYNPVTALADTLKFTSATGGVEATPGNSTPFTCSTANGTFYNNLTGPTSTGTIFEADSSTIKVNISVFYYNQIIKDQSWYYFKIR